jgi:hypothetical protein
MKAHWMKLLLLFVALGCFAQAQTIDELKQRAQDGDADAMNTIGSRYWIGEGVKQDYAEAMHWLRLAADNGNDEAMNGIAIMYESGNLGVTRNYEKAMYWRRLAAEKGNNGAMFGLGNMYVEGLGVKQDYGQAMKWFRKAADAGNDLACEMLGYGYEHGYGVKTNLPIAAYWYAKYASSAFGARDSSAKAAVARLRKRGVQPAKSGDLPDGAVKNQSGTTENK